VLIDNAFLMKILTDLNMRVKSVFLVFSSKF